MGAVHLDPHRSYRERCVPRDGEVAFQIVLAETDLRITVRSPLPGGFEEALLSHVRQVRSQLESWILLHPAFRHSLIPVPLPPDTSHIPDIIQKMTYAATLAGVGPFAAVAGAIAHQVASALTPQSPDLIIENGGDIFMYSTRDRIVGLLPDPKQGITFGVRITAASCPTALCASSATIGHSLSFGNGDLAVVRAADGAIADALATAFCNGLKSPADVDRIVKRAKKYTRHGVTGIFVQCGEAIGIWGDMELAVVD